MADKISPSTRLSVLPSTQGEHKATFYSPDTHLVGTTDVRKDTDHYTVSPCPKPTHHVMDFCCPAQRHLWTPI